jgi:RNA methyltransferase, TrmH family
VITSLKNPRVAQAVRLKKRAIREEAGRFLVEGAQAVGEALTSSHRVEILFHTDRDRLDPIVGRARAAGVDVQQVSDPVMARLTSTVTPQGLVAVVPFVDVSLAGLPPSPGCIAVLHAVRDPGNAGTVLRSADAAGADGVVFCTSSVDVYNPKAVRASAGSVFHLPVVREVPVQEAVSAARSRGMSVYAASARGRVDVYALDLATPTAFLFGNEAWGLPREVESLADDTVRVPLWGQAESLNLAAAATVCLFESARQRLVGEIGGPTLASIIAGAAHDIRSPLTAVKGFGSTLLKRWPEMSDEQRELMLEAVVFDAERLNMSIKQLIDAARVASGGLELSRDRVEVGDMVREMAKFLSRSLAYPEIRWEGDERQAVTDPERLRGVLAAFVDAASWWAQEGPVTVSAELRDDRLELAVRRGGAELSTEDAEALFRAREPGTGGGSKIGLFVARGVAEAQGGTAWAKVEDGVLVLRLSLPVV